MKERLLLIRILPIAFLILLTAVIAQVTSFNTINSSSFSSNETTKPQPFEYWTLEELKQLEKEDILYATTYGNSSKIHLTGGNCIGYNGSMTDLYDKVLREKRLPKIHQSFIVNDSLSCCTITQNYRKEKKYTVHINGKKLKVSREYNGLVDFLIKPCEEK